MNRIDTVNIWYSPQIEKWSVCILIKERDLLKRHKTTHDNLFKAVIHVLKLILEGNL